MSQISILGIWPFPKNLTPTPIVADVQAILAVEHQRLVKYPLLLEQLHKSATAITGANQQQQDSEDAAAAAGAGAAASEAAVIKRCVDRSREILECIDQQARLHYNATPKK